MAPATPPERISDTGAFEREHEHLMDLVAQLEAAQDPAEMPPIVAKLEASLPGHFAREEAKDGVFDWLTVLAPALSLRIGALIEDHTALRAALKELALGGPGVVPKARAFADRLRDHERREGEVLRDAKAGPP